MPLGSKQTTELWTPVLNKATGKPYVGLERCSSLEKLEAEDKELSDLIDAELNKWMDKDQEAHGKELHDFKKGFQYKHTDGYTYKLIQFDNGNYSLSRSKPFAGGKGGYSKGASYIHLRTAIAKVCRIEQLAEIIDNQEDNDNWEVMQLTSDAKGDKFLLLNKKPYTPTVDNTTTTSEKVNAKEETTGKEEDSQETEEPTTEE